MSMRGVRLRGREIYSWIDGTNCRLIYTADKSQLASFTYYSLCATLGITRRRLRDARLRMRINPAVLEYCISAEVRYVFRF